MKWRALSSLCVAYARFGFSVGWKGESRWTHGKHAPSVDVSPRNMACRDVSQFMSQRDYYRDTLARRDGPVDITRFSLILLSVALFYDINYKTILL